MAGRDKKVSTRKVLIGRFLPLYFSGKANMTTSDLNSRLQEMLRLNISGTDASASSSYTRKPLVEVVDSSAQTAGDDDGPPPLFCSDGVPSFKPQPVSSAKPSNEAASTMSLAEQMMSDANAAAREKTKEEDSKRQQNASKVRFKKM